MLFFFEHHGMQGGDLFRVNEMRDQSFPAHMHRAYELIYLHTGALSVQVEQRAYRLSAGELAFVSCNQIHSFTSPGRSHITVVLFSPELIGDFYSANKGRVPAGNVIALEKTPDWQGLESVYAQKSFLYHICDRLLAATDMIPAENQLQVAVMQQMLAYIDRHFGEECSLKSVAGSLQYDYAYLSKLFTELAGMHFTQYLNNYRIAQACYLLQNGGYTVSQIAARCGYTTMRTFHRNFHHVTGCSPRAYLAQGGQA